MADEFRHKDVGDELTKAEWEAVATHIANGQIANDMLYFNGTYWIRGTPATIAALLSFANLSDVNVPTPTDGYFLEYDDASGLWIASAHKAVTTGVHGAGSDHLALFGVASAIVSKVIWKDVSEEALAILNRTSFINWTDLDLTAYTSSSAKFAILGLRLDCDSYTSGLIYMSVRKNGTTPTYTPQIFSSEVPGNIDNAHVIVGLDAGQVIEYFISVTNAQADFYIHVLGYIE